MNIKYLLPMLLTASLIFSCADQKKEENPTAAVSTEFNYEVEQFADVKILRYQIPGFENLTLKKISFATLHWVNQMDAVIRSSLLDRVQ